MKSALRVLILTGGAAAIFAAQPLFNSATQSQWTVTQGSKTIGTITLLTSASGTRAEFASPTGSKTTLLGGNNSVWMRTNKGDVELATISAATPETTAAAALLLPFTTTKNDAVVLSSGKTTSYKFRGATATYTYDSKGPSKVDLNVGGKQYTLTRKLLASSTADASNFRIQSASGRVSRLARLSGDLLGPTDTSVSATAGAKGAGTPGLHLKDGGNYDALETLEKRDTAWKAKMAPALDDFQKSGKVGKSREGQQ